MKVKTLIIGNGDVRDVVHGRELAKETDADGIMLGRAIFGNPWLFKNRSKINSKILINFTPNTKEKLKVLVEHTRLFEKLLGRVKNFAIMKKHYKAYVNGFDGAKELRMKLMEAENSNEVKAIVDNFMDQNKSML